jgi:hypothetical protein
MSDKHKQKNWFKRHKIWTTVIALLVLFMIIGAANSGKNTSTNNATASTTNTSSTKSTASNASTAATTPKLNQVANDGKFSFTITSFSCGETQITQPDDSYQTSQAQGQFCIMNLTVKNIGSVAQSFDASSQYVYDNTGKQYSYSSDATITANTTSSQFSVYESVNPGVTVSGIVVFDIPKGVVPVTATLHDAGASNGVKVILN